MGTSFDCNVSVTAHPGTGQLGITIGPLDMGNLNEMLDYMASPECRESVMEAATRALAGNDFTPVGHVHVRANTTTAVCGIALWTINEHGQSVAAVPSVGAGNLSTRVTCPACLEWMKAQP